MPSFIEQIAREANGTFSKDVTDPDFVNRFDKLVSLLGELQASDLKVDESLQNVSVYTKRISPCLYIDVFYNEIFLIGIYILNTGVTVPLHDHPGMHGILKVIEGSVTIASYTEIEDNSGDIVAPGDVRNAVERSQRNVAFFIPVNKHEPVVVGVKDLPSVLRPAEGNFHEISAVGDRAVFVEIIAPPYDKVQRECTFYKVLETTEQDAVTKTWLVKTAPDAKFYTTNLHYSGPEIMLYE